MKYNPAGNFNKDLFCNMLNYFQINLDYDIVENIFNSLDEHNSNNINVNTLVSKMKNIKEINKFENTSIGKIYNQPNMNHLENSLD